jgi:hypothetical protein
VAEFSGFPPDGGGLIGFEVGTGSKDTDPSTIRVIRYQVREIESAPEEAASKP